MNEIEVIRVRGKDKMVWEGGWREWGTEREV